MPENQIDSRPDGREVYEKPFIRTVGTVAELTMANASGDGGDSGSGANVYS